MKVRDKSPILKDMITILQEKSRENKAPVWKAVARGLNRPNRKGYKVNLYRLEKFCKAKETVAVPGNVLGTGAITKGLDVAALRFSDSAKEKITKAGGTCMGLLELVEKNPKGSKVRIIG